MQFSDREEGGTVEDFISTIEDIGKLAFWVDYPTNHSDKDETFG